MVVENSDSIQVRQQYLGCNYTKFELTIPNFFGCVLNFSKSIQILVNFTIGVIGNETGRLLECVELYGKLINKSETQRMVRRNISATSLKMLWKNLYSVKCYDKLNMNVFTLSLWENFWWGLIHFDQFIYFVKTGTL